MPNRVFAIIAIVIGIMLLLGATMFLFVSFLTHDPELPVAISIAPIVQLLMGFLSIASGVLMLKRCRKAKWLFFTAIAIVFVNLIYLIVSFIPFIQSR